MRSFHKSEIVLIVIDTIAPPLGVNTRHRFAPGSKQQYKWILGTKGVQEIEPLQTGPNPDFICEAGRQVPTPGSREKCGDRVLACVGLTAKCRGEAWLILQT